MNIQERQDGLLPQEDLSPYAGQWVALRNGLVVAHGPDAAYLRGFWGTDAVVMPVPHPGLRI